MNAELLNLFWPFSIFIILLLVIGTYCILATYNLMRALIGVEILIKAVTLLVIVCGYISGHLALAQSLVITLIVIEVVVITVAVGLVLGMHEFQNSLDVRNFSNPESDKTDG